MKIIFLGTTGVHHALIAAYLYIGNKLESNFQKYPGFADLDKEASGYPIFLGSDKSENMVYALGCETDISLVKKAIEQLTVIMGSQSDEIKVVPISIPDERILLTLTRIASITNAGNWYFWASGFIIKRYLSKIAARVKEIQNELTGQN
jgi:hypothetical protein